MLSWGSVVGFKLSVFLVSFVFYLGELSLNVLFRRYFCISFFFSPFFLAFFLQLHSPFFFS